MKRKAFETKCTCGGLIRVTLGKPTRFEHRVAKAKCQQCLSDYMFTSFVKVDGTERKIDVDVILVHATEFLKNEYQGIKNERLAALEAG